MEKVNCKIMSIPYFVRIAEVEPFMLFGMNKYGDESEIKLEADMWFLCTQMSFPEESSKLNNGGVVGFWNNLGELFLLASKGKSNGYLDKFKIMDKVNDGILDSSIKKFNFENNKYCITL